MKVDIYNNQCHYHYNINGSPSHKYGWLMKMLGNHINIFDKGAEL